MTALLPVEKHNVYVRNTILKTVFPGHMHHADKWIQEIQDIGDKMQRGTNLKCDMTNYTDLLHNPNYESLKNFAVDLLDLHELYDPEKQDAIVDEMWGATYKQNDYADVHAHYPSAFSFVYYLKGDTNSAPLIFADSQNNFSIPAITGTFTVFPAHLFHGVPKHTRQTERVIIAGNIITKDKKK